MSEIDKYTDEEKAKLTEVRRKMAEYLYTEIMPNIRNRVELGWGEYTYGGGKSAKQWRIVIWPDSLLMCYGFAEYKVLPDGTFKNSPSSPHTVTEQCMMHWDEIKCRCLEEVENCKEYRHTLYTFTV